MDFSVRFDLDEHFTNNTDLIEMEFIDDHGIFRLIEDSPHMMESNRIDEDVDYPFTVTTELMSGENTVERYDLESHLIIDEDQNMRIIIHDQESNPIHDLQVDDSVIRIGDITLIFDLGVDCD